MADRSDSLKLYEDQPQEVTTADILRKYGPTEPDERGMLLPVSRTGDKLSLDWPSAIYEPYQAIKRLVTRPVAPGYLSSSGDRGPIEDSFNAAAATAAPSLGLNYAGMAGRNSVGVFGGKLPMDKESRLSRVAEHDFNPSGKTWYHGSARADRLVEKGELDPRRATSGPMPYFTDDPAMASSYAIGKKSDTSLMDDGDVSRYFTVSPKDRRLCTSQTQRNLGRPAASSGRER